ncbi:GNAT family N-acetyltransferase [Escherichia albertii]|uniref:GNAT family N-acetyltransferase n=1 Tax=Escherichia albertii TaxID=208962 RepID=UPI000744292B|nr:GNAT family N-acetyltransferase [Escherichia albertii]
MNFEIVTEGDIEQCRALCNELMQHQYKMSVQQRHIFAGMNFDTRLKPSFENASEKMLVIAKDEGSPIGYLYVDIDIIHEENINPTLEQIPPWAWALYQPGESIEGLYPSWITPQKVGHLNNLYVKPEYQKRELGRKFMDIALDYFHRHEEVSNVFVHISNGNDTVIDFYKKFGFTHSHDVFKGIIYGYLLKIR